MKYQIDTWILASVTAGVLIGAPAAAANDALPAALAECAAVADDDQRLVCFDALASAQANEPVSAPAPQATSSQTAPTPAASGLPAAAGGPVPITDEVGRERVEGAREEERPQYSANVIRCEENQQSGQTYFFFENGQVWKQANYRRLRFRECRFEVTLSEDNFGYSLHIPSRDRRFRVTRIR